MSDEKILTVPKMLILVAMESEREKIVKQAFEKCGFLGRDDIWIVVTGIGKVSATLSTAMILTAVNSVSPTNFPNLKVVNVGVCGGNDATRERTCVQINGVENYDFAAPSVNNYMLKITEDVEDPNICLTQDHFCTDASSLPNDGKRYYVDMELYGIASACAQFGVSCTSLKAVSDFIGDADQGDQYSGIGFDAACERLSDFLAEFLKTQDVLLSRES